MGAAAIALALELKVGDFVARPTGDACARISYIDLNPGGVSWVWLESAGPAPRSVLRVQLEQVRACHQTGALPAD